MENVKVDSKLVAYCGIYCGTCPKYIKGKCPGCHENVKGTWCKIRTCNMDNSYNSCADCKEFTNVKECKKYDNPFSRMFEFFYGTDRKAGIEIIKEKGYEDFAKYMVENGLVAVKKKKK